MRVNILVFSLIFSVKFFIVSFMYFHKNIQQTIGNPIEPTSVVIICMTSSIVSPPPSYDPATASTNSGAPKPLGNSLVSTIGF